MSIPPAEGTLLNAAAGVPVSEAARAVATAAAPGTSRELQQHADAMAQQVANEMPSPDARFALSGLTSMYIGDPAGQIAMLQKVRDAVRSGTVPPGPEFAGLATAIQIARPNANANTVTATNEANSVYLAEIIDAETDLQHPVLGKVHHHRLHGHGGHDVHGHAQGRPMTEAEQRAFEQELARNNAATTGAVMGEGVQPTRLPDSIMTSLDRGQGQGQGSGPSLPPLPLRKG